MIKERIELMPSNLFTILLLSLTRMRTSGKALRFAIGGLFLSIHNQKDIFLPHVQTISVPVQTISMPVQTISVPVQTILMHVQTISIHVQTISMPVQTISVHVQTNSMPVQTFLQTVQTFNKKMSPASFSPL